MNKYSDIEIQTAENLLKEGYKWIARDESGSLFAYIDKPKKWGEFWWVCGRTGYVCGRTGYVCEAFVPIFQNIRFVDKEPTSLESIVHPQILDDVERRYLKAVIRPFRGKVLYIAKKSVICGSVTEYISIQLAGLEYTCFPCFKKGSMYKGMELHKKYSLEELGL